MVPLFLETHIYTSTHIYYIYILSGWWFQILFIFTPIWGRFLFWLIFSKGLKPPPRNSCWRGPARIQILWDLYFWDFEIGNFGAIILLGCIFIPVIAKFRQLYVVFCSVFFRSVPSLKKMVCLIYVHQSMTQVNRLADHPMDPSFLVLWFQYLEDHPMTWKWLITMVSKSPKGCSRSKSPRWLINGGH